MDCDNKEQAVALLREFTGSILFIPGSSSTVIISTLNFGNFDVALYLLVAESWLKITDLSCLWRLNLSMERWEPSELYLGTLPSLVFLSASIQSRTSAYGSLFSLTRLYSMAFKSRREKKVWNILQNKPIWDDSD